MNTAEMADLARATNLFILMGLLVAAAVTVLGRRRK